MIEVYEHKEYTLSWSNFKVKALIGLMEQIRQDLRIIEKETLSEIQQLADTGVETNVETGQSKMNKLIGSDGGGSGGQRKRESHIIINQRFPDDERDGD